MSAVLSPKLTLGPCLFNWKPEVWRDFYFRMADESCVDSVHLGEVVCSKRLPFFEKYIPDVADRLTAAGKEVVFSSLALVMTDRERDGVRSLTDAAGDILVEANDFSAAAAMAGKPHVIGPVVNVYNEGTLAYAARNGAVRVCLPPELPAATVGILAAQAVTNIEVMAFGRLPLAISARCYHARSRNLHKDGCQYVCAEDRDGMDVDTMEGKPFLAVNGTQTMSFHCLNLLSDVKTLAEMGVSHFRLSPHTCDMVQVASLFRDVLDGRMASAEAEERLADLCPTMDFANGYIHGQAGHTMVFEESLAE